jgi:hypothetical protein
MHMTLTSPTHSDQLSCEFFLGLICVLACGMRRAWGRQGQALARHVKRREEEKVYALYVAGLQLEREKRSRLRKRLEHNILRASK